MFYYIGPIVLINSLLIYANLENKSAFLASIGPVGLIKYKIPQKSQHNTILSGKI